MVAWIEIAILASSNSPLGKAVPTESGVAGAFGLFSREWVQNSGGHYVLMLWLTRLGFRIDFLQSYVTSEHLAGNQPLNIFPPS